MRAEKIRRQFYGVTQHARGKAMFTQLPGDESQQSGRIYVGWILAQYVPANVFRLAKFASALVLGGNHEVFALGVELK